jgi:preprotein translocase subunit SecD
MEGYRIRATVAILGVLWASLWVFPNVVPVKKWITDARINFGLDIQGGLQIVMGVDVQGVVAESTQRELRSIESVLAKENVVASLTAPNAKNGEIQINVTSGTVEKTQKLMDDNYGTMFQIFNQAGQTLTYRYIDAYMLDYRSRIISQAIETIRNRIDEFGVAEPSIAQQGDDRIMIQLPGAANAEQAKQLINTTAKLDFQIVSRAVSPDKLIEMVANAEKAGGYSLDKMKYSEYIERLNADLKTQIPADTVVYFERNENAQRIELGATPYLLTTNTGLSGNDLDDAFINYDGQTGSPVVSLKFNPVGANKFGDLTTKNVNEAMAIVLDRVVKSAPNINEPIRGGQAQITLGRGQNRDQVLNEAQMIATSLRAGALPARLEQLEERTVGPSLGADSIKKAQLGSIVGATLILLFLMIYYKGFGAIASVSIVINVLTLIALLIAFGASLTLPGIAGIALTVGFAVDANVLIQERIKEEIAKGVSWAGALKEGYGRAMSAILDSNVTVASVAFILFMLGTGPVRGFAVTLLIGIATTLFANVFVSKVIADTLVHKMGLKKISI